MGEKSFLRNYWGKQIEENFKRIKEISELDGISVQDGVVWTSPWLLLAWKLAMISKWLGNDCYN